MCDAESVSTAGLGALMGALGRLRPAVDDAERIDRIRLLERLKGAVAAAQAAETAAFAASQMAAENAREAAAARMAARAASRPITRTAAERVAAGVAAQIGLARRISPHAAARYVRFATVLVSDLPATYAALRSGDTSEWRAQLVARETGWLSRRDRGVVDRDLAPRLPQLGDRRVESAARAAAYRLDPAGAAARLRAAEADRRVTLRPAPDTMTRLTALLPLTAGVACYAALLREADSRRATGDPRGRGQVMADTLVQRLTGQADPVDPPVEINLVVTDQTLLAGGPDPGQLDDGAPIPAPVARALAFGRPDSPRAGAAPRWLRRLYRSPHTGELVAMESARRRFTPAQRRYIWLRDQTCRTPYCDAPIRHIDHVRPAAAGGPTGLANAQGLCESCNHTKQLPGWRSEVQPDSQRGRIRITTPTGHTYASGPPVLPGPPPPEPGTPTSPHPAGPGAHKRLPTRPPPPAA